MFGAKLTSSSSAAAVNPRLSRLQKAKWRKPSPRCILEASLDWCRSLASTSGVAYVVSLLCFVVQTVCIDAYLVVYMSSAVLLTLALEIPLLAHLAVYWREESAHRAAPSEWLAYSWLHAAKVVLLFCRVMPRLPSSNDYPKKEVVSASSLFGIRFDQFFAPTMLANLLLMTPVLYALLMFRTSKAIFGQISHRITVDLILHYDMLWHVVIDMVDQVDMFLYARLPEREESQAILQENQDSLIRIQTVIPLFLFLSTVFQAQAFPGVVVDRWVIPETAQPKQQDLQETFARRSTSTHRPMATVRERTLTGVESLSSEAADSAAPDSHNELLSPPPPPAPTFLEPVSVLCEPPLLAPGGLVGPSPSSSPPIPSSPSAAQPQASPSLVARSAGEALGGLEFSLDEPEGLRLIRRPRMPSDLGPPPAPRMRGCRKMHALPGWAAQGPGPSQVFGRRPTQHASGGEVPSRERYLRLEKDRRRRLQDIISSIHRQNIIIARKRSAMISIFFTDIPFLTIRLWLWVLLGNKYFPGLGVKNAICIILNGMQVTLVRFADRASFRDLQAQLVQYRVRFSDPGGTRGPQCSPEGELAGRSPNVESCPLPPTPTDAERASPPQAPSSEGRGRASGLASQAAWRRAFVDAERTVGRETVRSTGVCVHFWSLLLAFGVGFILAKGEVFIVTLFLWVQDSDAGSPPL